MRRGYRVGDLSLVYPLARGTGPALSMLLAILISKLRLILMRSGADDIDYDTIAVFRCEAPNTRLKNDSLFCLRERREP